MKKMSLHRTQRRAFVTTISAAKVTAAAAMSIVALSSTTVGCKKKPTNGPDPDDQPKLGKAIMTRDEGNRCYLDHPHHCPMGATCNPPPPRRVECPEDKDAGPVVGTSIPAKATRVHQPPAGKEDWLRVPPRLVSISGTECQYVPTQWCAPHGKQYECTPYPSPVKMKCTTLQSPLGTSHHFDSFVYKDDTNRCFKIESMDCQEEQGRGGGCFLPDGKVVQCP